MVPCEAQNCYAKDIQALENLLSEKTHWQCMLYGC